MADYTAQVNRAIDHIVANLDTPLLLESVAKHAGFSAFHFHRIFKATVGESLANFIKRVRLERAVYIMSNDQGASLTDVALRCGFGSSSDFSRSFKARFGDAPSRFDQAAWRARGKGELEALIGRAKEGHRITEPEAKDDPSRFPVRIRKLPARRVAYLRVLDSYREGASKDACLRLMDWADRRGFGDGEWLGYMWDDPEVVSLADCRYDVGVVADGAQPDGDVGVIDFPAMEVAEVEIKGSIALVLDVLQWLFHTWLPQSGYVPDDHPCFESWLGRPFTHGDEHFELHAHVPVVRAGVLA